jgi:Flp pilus assembly protein TadG
MMTGLSEIALSCVRKFSNDERGNVFLAVALALPLLIGAIGLGAEVSYWRVLHREMQDAADSAAIAAVTNNSPSYAGEAQSVTSHYGFANGVGQATAAGCAGNCYVVTISRKVPLLLSQVIGYTGDATVGGQKAVTIAATAVAQVAHTTAYPYCILALATSGVEGINTNGAPKADLRYQCHV